MLYDFKKIQHKEFVLKYKDPFNPFSLVPSNLDLPCCGKKYVQSDILSTIMTQLSRYSKNRSISPNAEWNLLVDFIAERFKRRFLKKNIKILTNERIASHINPVIKKLIENGGAYKELGFNLAPLTDVYTIHFFLKDITKVVMAKTVDADKCGQGISAWSKELNALFCPLFRAIEECFFESLKDEVLYLNKVPEAMLDSKVSTLFSHDKKQFVNDFKEYDSNQDADTQFLEDILLSIFADPKLTRLYREMRLKAKMKSVVATLINEALKSSGESATLFTNTGLNMMYAVLTTEVKDVSIEGYIGDDSFINASEIDMVNVILKFYPNFRAHLMMRSDVDYPLHTDFAGWWLSEFGVIPDILKLVAKFLSKDFVVNKNKCALTLWEREHFKVEGLTYFQQVQGALRDKRKFLNYKKLLYLRRIYADVYGMSAGNFQRLMNTFYYYCSDEAKETDNLKWGGFYISDIGFPMETQTEADKNMKRIKQIKGDLSVKI